MTRHHVAALIVGGLIIIFGGTMLIVCGRSPTCANPSSFSAVATLATTIVGAGGMVITGAYGHAQGGKSVPPPAPLKDNERVAP